MRCEVVVSLSLEWKNWKSSYEFCHLSWCVCSLLGCWATKQTTQKQSRLREHSKFSTSSQSGKQWRWQWELTELQTHAVGPSVVTHKASYSGISSQRVKCWGVEYSQSDNAETKRKIRWLTFQGIIMLTFYLHVYQYWNTCMILIHKIKARGPSSPDLSCDAIAKPSDKGKWW